MKQIITSIVLSLFLIGYISAQTTPLKSTTFNPAYTTPTDIFLHIQNEVDIRIKNDAVSNIKKSLASTISEKMTAMQWNPIVWTNNISPVDFTGLVMWSEFTPAANGGYTSHFWRGGTLISPRHIIFATHIPLDIGKKVKFFAKDGTVIERTVTNKMSLPLSGTTDPDVTVALLNEDVPSTITHYPIISKAEWRSVFKDEIPDPYLDSKYSLPIIYLDQEKKVLVSQTYKKSLYDESSKIFHSAPIEAGKRKDFFESLTGGDSGHPIFVLVGGKPVLISAHTTTSSGPNYAFYYNQINDLMAKLGGGYKLSTLSLTSFTSGATQPRPSGVFASNLVLTSDKLIYKVNDLIKAKVVFNISPDWTTWLKSRNKNQGEATFTMKDTIGRVLIIKKYAFDISKSNQVIDFDWLAQATDTPLGGKRFTIDVGITTDTVSENTSIRDLSFERNILVVKKTGIGSGNITGTGINCGTNGSDCAEIINFGTKVQLNAIPATDSKFTGWTGACTGMTCLVTINTEKVDVFANFDKVVVSDQPAPSSQAINRLPTAINATYTAFNNLFNINLSGSDLDYDSLTFTPNKLVLTYGDLTKTSEGKYVYTIKNRPAVDSKDIFTFTVHDGKGTSKDSGVVTINVPKAVDTMSSPQDIDSDGVADSIDLCQSTPTSLKGQINTSGCIPPKISSFDIRTLLSNNLRGISNFELGKSGIGKINFKNSVDLSRDNEQIDLDSHINISEKSVHIESSSIPELNVPATITLYNITEENPQILKDGEVCDPPQCVIESYSDGVLVFTVNGFSTYTVGETPKTTETPKEKKRESSSSSSSNSSSRSTSTGTSDEELIRILTLQLNLLISELNRLTGSGGSFTADLRIGISHPDVLKLQKFLNSKGLNVASSGPGSPGNETDFYGAKTATAVKKFQVSKGIISTGNVGPLTRSALNAI